MTKETTKQVDNNLRQVDKDLSQDLRQSLNE